MIIFAPRNHCVIIYRMRKIVLSVFALCACSASAQGYPNLWKNWYVQAGLDMSLQDPYGYSFGDVFPNGKTFGVDVALGRWFTPEIGVRGKFNWENGIGLFENHHAEWLAPFHEVGVNMDRGGYYSLTADIMFDLHNILQGYDATRRWNLQVYPQAGYVYNQGVSKGSPLIGIGIGNTYRLSDRYSIYCDLAFNGVSSGFVGVEKNTGTGSNFNGYFTLDLGVQFDLGKQDFTNLKSGPSTFWDGWFVQLGMDMTLQNLYRHNFADVLPKGLSFGMDAAIGKQFSHEIAARLRVKWENGLIPVNGQEWIAPVNKSGKSENREKGGYISTYMDVLLSARNLLCGYEEGRKWDFLLFPRAGLISNLAIHSGSPLVGVGCGFTRRLTDRMSLYGDMAYQFHTSEFCGNIPLAGTGMGVDTGSNGEFDFHIGVQWTLGKEK